MKSYLENTNQSKKNWIYSKITLVRTRGNVVVDTREKVLGKVAEIRRHCIISIAVSNCFF